MTENNMPFKKPTLGHIALLASAAAGAMLAGRYLAARKISAGEKLADALLNTGALSDAAKTLPDASETVLAACAAYFVDVAYHAVEGLGVASGGDDPIGHSRTQTHAYTHAAATVLTESTAPEQILTYAVTIPEVGEVRGTRRVGGLRMSGLAPARPTPYTAQVTFADDYTAQMESEFELTDYLVSGHTRLFGVATLRDNKGNTGRLNIDFDGSVSGTITRDRRIIGRFEGKVAQGVRFKQYQIEEAKG